MDFAEELRQALAGVCSGGPPEVHENGQWLAALHGLQYEVRSQGSGTLLHLWAENQSLVRRVVGVAEQSHARVVLDVKRLGQPRNTKLELLSGGANHTGRRLGREQFRERIRRLLLDKFPDETIGSLATAADLHRSISGSYTRGVMRGPSGDFAFLGAAPDEDSGTIDAILTFGLIWLDHARARAKNKNIAGLRLLLPRETSATTAHRLNALANPREIELFEYDALYGRLRRVSISDAGNVATWIVPRRDAEDAVARLSSEVERIRALSPDAIRVGMAAATRELTFRFRGLEFAHEHDAGLRFGLGDRTTILTPERWPALEQLVRQLDNCRNALASDTKHPLYRAQPERWLETMVAADPARIDARLDARFVYTQVPAFSGGDRGIIDLLTVTRDGRLAVLELKASEDLHLAMQAADYWLRVRWHHEQDDFKRYGYFPGVTLQRKPPLLILVAPGLRFHPATDIVQRFLHPEIEMVRVGLAEGWRRSVRVLFRQ